MDERSGRVSSPFNGDEDNDSDEDTDEEMVTDEIVDQEPAVTPDEPDTSASPGQDIPYILRRASVKDERVEKSFPLRDSTLSKERQVQQEVEALIEADVYDSDLREAAYLVGLRHADEVADVLLEWGYEYR